MIVKKKELLFLISCRSSKYYPALFEPDRAGEPQIILESLFQKGWIENTGERFRVVPEVAAWVKQISGADMLLCLYSADRRKELLYLYPGEKILAVQESFCRKDALRLLELETDEISGYLEEQGLLGEDSGWEPLPCTDRSTEILPGRMEKRSGLSAYPWVRLLAELVDTESGCVLGHAGIIRNGFRDEIIMEDRTEGRTVTEPYTSEKFTEILLDWFRQNKEGIK